MFNGGNMAYLNGKEYSPELAHKALVNIKKNGCTNVICPKCKKIRCLEWIFHPSLVEKECMLIVHVGI